MIVIAQIGAEPGETVVLLRIIGLIKLGESSAFFATAIEESFWSQDVILDLAGVDYIDSTGVGEFIGICVALARRGQKLRLMNETARITKLIELSRATLDLKVLTTEEAAKYREPLDITRPEDMPDLMSGHALDDDRESPGHGPTVPSTVRDARTVNVRGERAKEMRIITVHGKVQGVGYRFFATRVARRMGLKGWIQNMPDGTVAARVEGARTVIDQWLEALREGPRFSHVTSIDQVLMDFSGELRDFDVRF